MTPFSCNKLNLCFDPLPFVRFWYNLAFWKAFDIRKRIAQVLRKKNCKFFADSKSREQELSNDVSFVIFGHQTWDLEGGGSNWTPPQHILVFKYPSRDRVNKVSLVNFFATDIACCFFILDQNNPPPFKTLIFLPPYILIKCWHSLLWWSTISNFKIIFDQITIYKLKWKQSWTLQNEISLIPIT